MTKITIDSRDYEVDKDYAIHLERLIYMYVEDCQKDES